MSSLLVLAPSDLSGTIERVVRVGGRIRRSGHDTSLFDAFAAVAVEFVGEPPPDRCLAVVEGSWANGAITGATVVFCDVPIATAYRDVNRFCDHGVGALMRRRAELVRAIRGWFDARGFVEVETPQRVPSPGLDLHLDAFASDDRYLITSPEYQMKRLLVGGLPRIYQLVHAFRADERGTWHNSEFLMCEWYRAFAGVEAMIADTEQLIAEVATAAMNNPFIVRHGRRISLEPPFLQLTVAEAFHRFSGLDEASMLELAQTDEQAYFLRLVDEVEPGLAGLDRPVVLKAFPSVHASLARACPSDPRFCERFEVYVAGVELCNGFGELTDPGEQRRRFGFDQAQRRGAGKTVYPVDERFLAALEEGMPPSGGNALGVDRLIALCLGADRIGNIIGFPDDCT